MMENNIQQQYHEPFHASKSSFHFSKTFIIILVVILSAIVGVGGYMVGTNQNQVVRN